MENSLDIQKWRNKYIYLLKEEEEDFNITVGDNWNVTELSIGDTITPAMWNSDTIKGIHFFDYTAPKDNGWKIVYVGDDGEDNSDFYISIEGVDTGIDFSDWLNNFNTYLKPQYKVVLN
jgi:hypothetical protein